MATRTTPTPQTRYWNAFAPESRDRWSPVAGLSGLAEELTLGVAPGTGEVTRLTRFAPGADTRGRGARRHGAPEVVYVVSGRLYDAANERWLEAGHYESHPPGAAHGPFRTDEGCVVLEVYRQRVATAPGRNSGEAWPGPGI